MTPSVGRVLALISLLWPVAVTTAVAAEGLKDPESMTAAPQGVILGLDGQPDSRPDASFGETIQKHCSKCHVPPLPQYLPKGMWRLRIQEMAQRSLMGTGLAPGEDSILWQMDTAKFVRYFESRATATLALPDPWPEIEGETLEFSRLDYNPPGAAPVPVVANVRFWDLDGDGRLEIVLAEGESDPARLAWFSPPDWRMHMLRDDLFHPHSLAVADFNGNGLPDIFVAEMGLGRNPNPRMLIYVNQGGGRFEEVLIQEGVPNHEAKVADLTGDGRPDIVGKPYLVEGAAINVWFNET